MDLATAVGPSGGHGPHSTRRSYAQACPVAHGLDLVGERWTLLIVRDLMFGPLRFGEIRDGLPGLSANLLSSRLSTLVHAGVVEKVHQPVPGSRHVYRLTRRGRELAPVVHALARFGVRDWPDPDLAPPPRRLVRGALLALMDPESLGTATWNALIRLDQVDILLSVGPPHERGHALDRLRLREVGPDSENHVLHDTTEHGMAQHGMARVTTSLGTLWSLGRGSYSLGEALERDDIRIEGPDEVTTRLIALFGWSADAATVPT